MPSSWGSFGQPSGAADNISALLRDRGRIAGDSAARSGSIMADAVSSLGHQAAGYMQHRQHEKAVKAKEAETSAKAQEYTKQDQAFLERVSNKELPAISPEETMAIYGAERGSAIYKSYASIQSDKPDLGTVLAGFDASKPEMRALAWPAARAKLLATGQIPETVPEAYDHEWYEKTAGSWRKAGAAPKTREIKRRNADGSETIEIVEDKPGYSATSAADPSKAPAVGSFEDHVTQKYGARPTPEQIIAARKEYNQADDKTGSGASAPRHQSLVKAVIANPNLWDDLTPSVKSDIAADLATQGFSGFGKRLSDGAIAQISQSKAAIESVRDLRGVLQQNEQYIGPIAGLQAMNPWSDAKKAQADIDLVRQRVGKALEGGVLRKEDEEKYKKILATLTDEPELAIYKVDKLLQTLENDMNTFVEEQRLAGRRVNQGDKGKKPPKITNDAEFDALPSGAEFIDPNGRKRKKP